MRPREWGALAVLGALVVVMIVVGVKVFSGGGGGRDHHTQANDSATTAPPPPPAASDSPGAGATQSQSDDAVLPGSDVDAAHSVMVDYVQKLRSYTSDDRQQPWEQAALADTTRSPAMKALTRLPTGKAWAACRHFDCSVHSTAKVLRDTSVTDLPGSGASRQVVSYVDVRTVTRQRGSSPQKDSSQFVVTAVQTGQGWRVSGCSFAGVGDAGANGDGP